MASIAASKVQYLIFDHFMQFMMVHNGSLQMYSVGKKELSSLGKKNFSGKLVSLYINSQ